MLNTFLSSDHVERELGSTIAALQPDDVILRPSDYENPLITKFLAARHISFERIGSRQKGSGIAITMGETAKARLATQHLIGLGHQRLGFVAGPSKFSLKIRRVDGWKVAMNDAGLPYGNLCGCGDFGLESGKQAAHKLLSLPDRPNALICSSSQMTLAALEVAREINFDVPRDLSLVSFDNSPIVRFTAPPLTAVDQTIAAAASRAVELLIDSRKTPLLDEPEILTNGLVRGSIGPALARGQL